MKYTFEPGEPGSISVTLQHTADRTIEQVVGDNGKGLPEKIDTSKTLGWKRITLLTDQLRGKLEVDRDLPGTNIRIRF